MKTQKQMILDELKKGSYLSKQTILKFFNCWNSGEVVRRLRKEGYNIQTRFVKCENKRGKYAEYYMPEYLF